MRQHRPFQQGSAMRSGLRYALWSLALLAGAGATLVYCAPIWVIDHAVRLHLWGAGVTSRYVQVDGERIHYLETRPRPNAVEKPLLLIHGLGAKAEDWAPMLPTFAAQGFHVYA